MRPSALLALVALSACAPGGDRPAVVAGGDTARATAVPAAAAGAFDPARWAPPPESAIPNDAMGASIRRGLALVRHTTDSLPRHAPGRITCSNCHLDAGRDLAAAPLVGTAARFPKVMARTGGVVGLADRVNYCFTRSLAGTRLPTDSREMQDILAYLAFLSRGVPVGAAVPGAEGLPAMPAGLVGDRERGAQVYEARCAACHGTDGGGGPTAAVPALWGPRSYAVGASMARQERAASFIWHNMPLGQGRSLTPQEAFDVAAYVNAHPRPDSPGKELDWPGGGAPRDVPYDTRAGHRAFAPPPLLPRADPAGAVVPPPVSVGRTAAR